VWTRVASAVVIAAAVLVVPAAPALAAPCGPTVTDPLAEAPWPLQRLRPENAWPLSVGKGVTVAVVDSGVSAEHPTLTGKVQTGRDFVVNNGPGTCDENGHGTLIGGIIAGSENTSAGYRFYGMAPAATIVPVRVLRDQRRSTEADLSDTIAEAIRWSVDEGRADVINLSLTTPPTPGLEQAVAYAVSKRVVVVAAAGNEGGQEGGAGQPVYPAAYPGVIAVAGVNDKDTHVSSSTSGDFVDVSAPGENIAGPSPAGGGYLFTKEGGTSFAAAYVSGVAALIRSYDPGLGPDEVSRRITETADHPPQMWTREVGHGVVNPARAVGALRPAVAAGAAGNERVPPPVDETDPLANAKVVAGWAGGIGAVVALLAILLVPVVRRGRQRGWRAGP
jgi:membrane-anchored mycosin MYCP